MEKSINEEIVDYLKEHDMYYVEEFDEEGFPIDDEANDFVGDLTKAELCDILIESMEDIAEIQRKRDIEKAEQFCIKWFENIIDLWLTDLRDEPFHTKAVNEVKERLHKSLEEE